MAPDRADRGGFSEKDFYLAEFRGRTLAFALPSPQPEDFAPLGNVLAELASNQTRVVVLSCDRVCLEKIAGDSVVRAEDPRWLGRLWQTLRLGGRAGLLVSPAHTLAQAGASLALRLGVAKLVWIDSAGGLQQANGERLSCSDLLGLERLIEGGPAIAEPSRDVTRLLPEIVRLLRGGFSSVAICGAAGLGAELFSYEGSGTLFTRDLYTGVRSLSLDEFDAAHDLIRRGVDEGYLVARSADQLDEILANAFGVFVEGRFLAGVGALLPHEAQRAGEIASLYTLTRFIGEGIGGFLVRFALDRAREHEFDYVFACTTSERVVRFFERNGFLQVKPERIPSEKWRGYAPDRCARVCCLRRDLKA